MPHPKCFLLCEKPFRVWAADPEWSVCASCAPAQDEAGLEEKCPERARTGGGAVPGIMSRYAQRPAAGTARALSASAA